MLDALVNKARHSCERRKIARRRAEEE